MKWISIFFLGSWLTCGIKSSSEIIIPNQDSISQNTDSLLTSPDSVILEYSNNVLLNIKNTGCTNLGNFIHPEMGIRFSPYGYIDTINDIFFTRTQYIESIGKSNNDKKLVWGSFDGSGEPIKMNIEQYFKRFVYDVDFINAPSISLNKCKAGGNSQNNIFTVYEGYKFVEYYFPGFDPKYDGMDWKTLRLVFMKSENMYYLVGVVHDEWTI